MVKRKQPVETRDVDVWKASTFLLAGVFVLVVGRHVDAALAQMKTVPQGPQKITSVSPPPPKAGPTKIGGAPSGPEKIVGSPDRITEPPAEGFQPGDKKGNPAERAVKLMEAAKKTLMKMKPDPAGRRDKALKHIETATSEAKAIPVEGS